MKQVTQRLRDGQIEVLDVPAPLALPEGVLVDVRASLLSAGTERSTAEAARRSLIGKAKARPAQARAVVEKARRDGVRATLDAVRIRLDQPSAVGYSSAGVVIEAGALVSDLRVGDRVACAGGGYAVHADVNYVPANLAVQLPDSVPFESGAFATVGSIALQGVRQAEPQIGERVAVIGLGLVGQLTCRILRASGCEVVAIDLVDSLVKHATKTGATVAFERSELDPGSLPQSTRDCDAIVITAATASGDPIQLAGALARDRARIVVVGDVGMSLPRSSFYGKELDLRLSRSYGPGRYDRHYEERGLDYPIGYVRWTERRNLAAFVAMLADGRVVVDDLITARFPVEEAADAYDQLVNGPTSPLGQVLTYAPVQPDPEEPTPRSRPAASRKIPVRPRVGVIGAGSFSQRVLIPGLSAAGFELSTVASANGLSARGAKERFDFRRTATPDELLDSEDLDAVVIATRHDTHALYAIRALERDLPVFVEKPPAITEGQLDELCVAARGRVLQVGFNRRFAPLARAARDHVSRRGDPIELLYRVAAGRLSADHWLNDSQEGGGRLVGEGCHFVDFACWFLGALPNRISATLASSAGQIALAQRFAITMTFANDSVATIMYGSESAARVEKELVEAHAGGRSSMIRDYRRLELAGLSRSRTIRARRQDKGHREQFIGFRRLIEGVEPDGPNPLDTMAMTLQALASVYT
jgi:predicted dehydrogenase/threonine dehydrogenase-like Zn-dependent dehydrogenase